MGNKRFSKATVLEVINHHLAGLQAIYNFDPQNGYAQIEGLPDFVQRAYGKFTAYEVLAHALGLQCTIPYDPAPGESLQRRYRMGRIRE